MRFSQLPITTYFRFVTEKTDTPFSLCKSSPFGYKDHENTIYGEIQTIGDPEVETKDPIKS